MKLKLLIILILTVSLLYGQDRRKVGLIPTINESGPKFDWISYGLEYLLFNKLSVLSGFYVIDRQKFREELEAAGFDYKTIPDTRLIYRMGKDAGIQIAVSGRYKVAANTLSLEITFSNAFNGTEILTNQYQDPLSDLFGTASKITDQLINLAGIGVSEKDIC